MWPRSQLSASSPVLGDAWRPFAEVSWLRTPRWAGPHMFTEDCTFYPHMLSVLSLSHGVTARLPQRVTADMLASNGKWRCASVGNKRKMLKKWLFSHFLVYDVWSQSVPEHCVQKRAFSALFMPAYTRGLKKASKANKLEAGDFLILNLTILK